MSRGCSVGSGIWIGSGLRILLLMPEDGRVVVVKGVVETVGARRLFEVPVTLSAIVDTA